MIKRVSRKQYDAVKHKDFLKVSANFAEGAVVASEFEYHNAAGVLIIHAAIALADALTIRFASVKCSGDNHYEIIKLLEEVIRKSKESVTALNHFKKLIDHKNVVSYHGEIYSNKDVEILFKHYNRFSEWANNLFY